MTIIKKFNCVLDLLDGVEIIESSDEEPKLVDQEDQKEQYSAVDV
jgi:hypothetical protein